MPKFIVIDKDDLQISQSTIPFYGEESVNAIVVSPSSGIKSSDSSELPFTIQSVNQSIPIIKEDFCLVSRTVINLTEQHANEREATLSGNKSKQNPQKPLKENMFFVELKGENG